MIPPCCAVHAYLSATLFSRSQHAVSNSGVPSRNTLLLSFLLLTIAPTEIPTLITQTQIPRARERARLRVSFQSGRLREHGRRMRSFASPHTCALFAPSWFVGSSPAWS